jgi:hypothetical protein
VAPGDFVLVPKLSVVELVPLRCHRSAHGRGRSQVHLGRVIHLALLFVVVELVPVTVVLLLLVIVDVVVVLRVFRGLSPVRVGERDVAEKGSMGSRSRDMPLSELLGVLDGAEKEQREFSAVIDLR